MDSADHAGHDQVELKDLAAVDDQVTPARPWRPGIRPAMTPTRERPMLIFRELNRVPHVARAATTFLKIWPFVAPKVARHPDVFWVGVAEAVQHLQHRDDEGDGQGHEDDGLGARPHNDDDDRAQGDFGQAS